MDDNKKLLNADDLETVSGGAYFIGGPCICCGACADVCPVGAISGGEWGYSIDSSHCIGCGTCAYVCPIGAPQKNGDW